MSLKIFWIFIFILGIGFGFIMSQSRLIHNTKHSNSSNKELVAVSVNRSPASSGKVFHTTKGVYNQIFDIQIHVVSFAATDFTTPPHQAAYQIKVIGRVFPLKGSISNTVLIAWDLPVGSEVLSGPFNQEISAEDFNQAVEKNNGYYESEFEVLVPAETTLSFSASSMDGKYKLGNSATLKATLESLQSVD